jgi:hypothetical protein
MKTSNGRINLIPSSPNIQKLFAMYDKIPANQCASFRESTIGLWDETRLSSAFFSNKNMQIVQNGIRAGVYAKSNGQYLIDPQDCDSLKVIMRSIFLQNSANLDKNIASQISHLNNMVLDYCVEQVYGEAQGYMNYLRDVSTINVPLAPPSMDYTDTRRTHKMSPWF